MNILEQLRWRYATKAFDATKKLSDIEVGQLVEAAHLAPSSFGLEPWKFMVVTNPELRGQLRAASWDQSQITDASHLIVLATKKTMTVDDVDAFIARTAAARGMTVDQLAGYADMIKGSIGARSAEAIASWNRNQVYLALGFLLETAAVMNIDACPMEGFDPSQYDQLLGLTDSDYTVAVVCPVGHRAESDGYATAAKVRRPLSEVVSYIA